MLVFSNSASMISNQGLSVQLEEEEEKEISSSISIKSHNSIVPFSDFEPTFHKSNKKKGELSFWDKLLIAFGFKEE